MTSATDSQFAVLLAQLREGSQDAAWELVELYGPHILRAVRRSLSREIRPKFDSQDFVQAVWASLFTHRDRLLNVNNPEQLIALLASMARHKIVDEVRRRFTTQKYNVRRERSLDDSDVVLHGAMRSDDPTPSQFAMARERWDQLMAARPKQTREIVQMRLAGETHEAIAERLGISPKTVQRVIHRLLRETTP